MSKGSRSEKNVIAQRYSRKKGLGGKKKESSA